MNSSRTVNFDICILTLNLLILGHWEYSNICGSDKILWWTCLPFEHHVYTQTTVHSGGRLHIALKCKNPHFPHFPKSVLNGLIHKRFPRSRILLVFLFIDIKWVVARLVVRQVCLPARYIDKIFSCLDWENCIIYNFMSSLIFRSVIIHSYLIK